MLAVHDLTIGYPMHRAAPYVVAEGIDVALEDGELVCLIGPNGAGKSTLMRTLAGMQAPLAGRVLLDGEDIHTMPARARAQRLSVVLTDRQPVGLLSAYALVGLGRYPHTGWSGKLTEEDHAVVRWALATVGAEALADRHVGDLSDGERQKVMLARALAQEPRLMILDELTAFLDLPRRVESMQLMRHLARTTNRAILLSTHDLDLALRSADRIWLLPAEGPMQTGAPEDLVLSGAFEAAFASEGVDFDRARGTFRIHQEGAERVQLIGEGVERYWTQHALERAGLQVGENGEASAWRVEVRPANEAERWRVVRGAAETACATLYEVVRLVRAG